jgi:hypothetical protein
MFQLRDLHGFVRLDGEYTAQDRAASGLVQIGLSLTRAG